MKRKSPLKMKKDATGTPVYDLHKAFHELGQELVAKSCEVCEITPATYRSWKNNPEKLNGENKMKIVNVALSLIIEINCLFEKCVGAMPKVIKFPTSKEIKSYMDL